MANHYPESGPHIRATHSVNSLMRGVVIALLPATIASVFFFGPYSLYLVFGTVIAAVVIEYPFNRSAYTKQTPFGDGSAVVAGMILGLSLSPTSAWWVPPLGAFLAIVVGKQAFGGLGNNPFNPALVARAILLLALPFYVGDWVTPFDAVSTATPMEGGDWTYLSLFLGNVPGSIGETSALALLIGAAYMYFKGHIGAAISVSFIAAAALTAVLLGIDPLYTILAGSLMYGALYMATDYVTSTMTLGAKVAFGVGCGVLTVLIREFTVYPAGVTFAILIMNGAAYFLDSRSPGRRFGALSRAYKRGMQLAAFAAATVAFVAIAWAGVSAARGMEDTYLDARTQQYLDRFFPDADSVTPAEEFEPHVTLHRVMRGEEHLGYLGYTSAGGYIGPIDMVVALDPDGVITVVRVVEHQESSTLGSRVASSDWLAQFEGISFLESQEVLDRVDMISGATVSSRAAATAVQRLLESQDPAVAEEPAEAAFAELEDGTYTGSARGYNDQVEVEFTVEDGEVTSISVVSHGDTPGIAEPAFDRIIEEVISAQSLEVDIVSGATASSEGLLNALRAAMDVDAETPEAEDPDEVAVAEEEPEEEPAAIDPPSDGTYRGVGQGYGGEIELEVTVEGGEITEITVLSHSETAGIGDAAMEELAEAVVSGQTLEVDSISGATVTSEGYLEALAAALEADDEADADTDADAADDDEAAELEDGTFTGSGEGYGGEITVEVTVEGGAIVDIVVTDHSETPGLGDGAFEELVGAVTESQSTEVDTVSGATGTSDGFLEAVRAAIGL